MAQALALGVEGNWLPVRDGDPRALALYERHYSVAPWRVRRNRLKGGRRDFAGPDHLILLTVDCRALFVWRRERYRLDGQQGVCCAVFRNEGAMWPVRSSDLIREADALADARWPGKRHYTYVNPQRVASPNPGYCFKRAGWRLCGRSAKGLLILERLPVWGWAERKGADDDDS